MRPQLVYTTQMMRFQQGRLFNVFEIDFFLWNSFSKRLFVRLKICGQNPYRARKLKEAYNLIQIQCKFSKSSSADLDTQLMQ